MRPSLQFLLVRPTAFEKAEAGSNSAPVENLELSVSKSPLSKFVAEATSTSERPDLTSARGTALYWRGLPSNDLISYIFLCY